MKRVAPKACIPCRDRKRKCDRTLPSCSLCYRLGRHCQYGLLSPSPSSPSSESGQSGVTRKRRVSPPKLHIPSLFNHGMFTQPSVSSAITEQLSMAVGNVSNIRVLAARYFSTIHLWLPVVSESLFYERLPNTFTKPRADVSLLSLSMAIITTIPTEKGLESMSSLYTLVKGSIAIIEAANLNTPEVVQARLLVSLFETGHALPAAYISLAGTARAAAAIKINETINDPCSPSSEESRRLWWGIVMLDRYYTLERGDGPCATQDLGSPQHLPRDGNLWDQQIIASNEPLPMSTPSSVRVGPFARQAQISHVVNLLLIHLHDQKIQGSLDVEESDQLARTLLAFSKLLPEETPQPWPRYCGAMGMCFSSLMVLHASRESFGKPNATSNFFHLTLDGISWIADKFNKKVGQVDFEAVSPFPPHSVMLAASANDKLWRATGDPKHLDAANSLVTMLRLFSKRWLGARKYLSIIEEERCMNVPGSMDGS